MKQGRSAKTIWSVAQFVSLSIVLAACVGTTTLNRTQVPRNLVVAPVTLNFGNVPLRTSSATQIVTLTNNSSGSININSITMSGPFASTGVNPVTLNAGQNMKVNITFTPTASGLASGTLTITSTAANSPITVALAGTGTTTGTGTGTGSGSSTVPQIAVNPTSLSFVNVNVGETQKQSLTVSNTGTASLSITAANVTGTGFRISSLLLPLTLTPGTSEAITVTFAPLSSGNVTGNLSLVSNAASSPTAIALSGSGSMVSSPLQIKTTSLPPGQVDSTYLVSVLASGGVTPYAWTVSFGSLPPGLSLSPGGIISGIPTKAGTYNFATTVVDSSGQTAVANFTVSIGNEAGQGLQTVPNAFFGLSIFGTPACANNVCDPSTSYPLQGDIVPGTLGKVGFITGNHIEPTCDGGTNPNNGCYDWSNLDVWVNFAQSNGLTLVYDWSLPPGWQCGLSSSQSCTLLPANITYMSNFATALATRYKGKIKYYETGNEVNSPSVWADTCANLVLLNNTIYSAIKSVDPNATVGAPNMAAYEASNGACGASPTAGDGPSPNIWIQNFLQTRDRDGNLPSADTIGVHTYAVAQPALANVAQRLLDVYNQFRSVMTSAGIPTTTPLLVTEGGFGPTTNGNCSAPLSSTACLNAAQQVAYIGRWLVLGASTWSDGGGQLATWYAYDINWGTLNGTNGMNPQNASAYGQMEGWLTGAVFTQQCHTGTPSTVYVCDFTNDQGQQSEIIFNDDNGATTTYTTPIWATIYQPLLGSAQPVSQGSVTVADTPILLR